MTKATATTSGRGDEWNAWDAKCRADFARLNALAAAADRAQADEDECEAAEVRAAAERAAFKALYSS
jgi:hypothetical protein